MQYYRGTSGVEVVIIFRMTATMTTLDFLLASARPLEKALRWD